MTDWKPGDRDRRQMSQDQVERDRLLTEVHTNMTHLVNWTKEHAEQDSMMFKAHASKIEFLQKMTWLGIGGIAALQFILKAVK